ncbi:sulfite exporter TauE/SafE family protein [Roseitranquillus sediminis]|uniref:sulfite exporter TauE/SafE family protein n=1 Tax=Roseitranquillus sediminis TaxID=2809051 RepID=UPI001D0CB09B|nr:sulfite exporter TauE/SafE family protein [Roseitranquillus sediminis]MBM9596296.1 sulfite exporter TauE/SafE family protein [Roseitranquillus sediminis]
MAGLDWVTLALAAAITLAAGFVKGAVGFAMPMIMISGLGSILPAELALAALILPTLASNLFQAARDGVREAAASARRFWRYILVVLIFIVLSAQMVRILPQEVMLLILGVIVTVFCVLQLAGWRLYVPQRSRARAEVAIGALAGGMGGVSGVWGPPTVMYLTAIDTPKREHLRVQGVVYALGAVALTLAHLRSGVLDGPGAMLSAAMLVPAALGMAVGVRLQDALDPGRFRRATLIVLIVAGLNLIRRAVM